MTDAVLETEDQPPNTLTVLLSPHLKRLVKTSPAVAAQFLPSPKEHDVSGNAYTDPLLEDAFIKTKGLVYKYPRRVLVELTLACASYCRFCTRRRIVSDIEKGKLTPQDFQAIITYVTRHTEINEVILSGGDPLAVPLLLQQFLRKVKKVPHLKIIRIHTRVPVSHPQIIPDSLYSLLATLTSKALYLSIHFEHPDELTKPTLNVIRKLRRTGASLLSQSVFLKGVNDNYETLRELFTRLSELGIRPYYIYRCDPVKGAEHFIVPFEKEVEIMTKLRKNLSGIAFPTYVIDAPNGAGKIPVPLNFWKFDTHTFHDFEGKKLTVFTKDNG